MLQFGGLEYVSSQRQNLVHQRINDTNPHISTLLPKAPQYDAQEHENHHR